MIISIENNPTYEKVRHLILSRYGKQIQLQTLTPLMNIQASDSSFQKEYIRNSNFFINLTSRNQYLGTIQIREVQDIKTEDLNTISNLVRLYLEPYFYISYLERKEKNLKIEKELGWPVLNEALSMTPKLDEEYSRGNKPHRKILFIKSNNLHVLSKTAFTIHEKIGSWAYAPLSDVKKSLMNSNDLKKLDGMTLFVESFKSLSIPDITMLTEYVQNDSFNQGPFFVVGIQDSLERGINFSNEPVFDESNSNKSREEQEELLELYLN